MTKKAAIFDLDGTVLNTLPDLADSLNLALAAFDLPTRELSACRQMVGNGLVKMIERALPPDHKDPATQTKVMAFFKNEYARRQCDKTTPYEGIMELLQDLVAKDWSLGLLSNKDHENAVAVVNHYFPGIFSQILGVKPGVTPKPDPTGALAICASLGQSPKEVFYVGDSAVDMATAKGAGCRPIGVAWGFRPQEELLESGALAILTTPADFHKVVANW
ncbi:MAG: HAD family hydrolase [Deltaproteobacteria bacterium]|nr:HAD family hydrolase [Deltaproteobacteria bacterium]